MSAPLTPDALARLREAARGGGWPGSFWVGDQAFSVGETIPALLARLDECDAEIARLRAEVERLRAAGGES